MESMAVRERNVENVGAMAQAIVLVMSMTVPLWLMVNTMIMHSMKKQ